MGKNFTAYSVNFKNSQKYSLDYEVAKSISKKFNIKFNRIETNFEDFKYRAEDIVDIVEELTGNTNSIANLMLSENVKVLFSGDGGDEVFTGYNKYKSISILSKILKFNPLKNYKIKFNSKFLKRLFYKQFKESFFVFQ